MSDEQPSAVISPLKQQIDKLSEAARLLQPTRPDLAAACAEAADTLREETEIALWDSAPVARAMPG